MSAAFVVMSAAFVAMPAVFIATTALVVTRPAVFVAMFVVFVAMFVVFVVTAVFVSNSCEPLTASVDVADKTPAPTFWICRSEPATPTETTEATLAPAAVAPLNVKAPVLGAAVTELDPKATSFALTAWAPAPRAVALLASVFD